MEHKLITGAEQYLPFARSRIKALRAAGMNWASQQFEIDGNSIKVRISGEHEYITLSGGSGNVLSGIVRDGVITSPGGGASDYLTAFKPTVQAWIDVMKQKPSGAGPTIFSDNTKLAVTRSSQVPVYNGTNSQNRDLTGSMYSGLMAPLVQFLMGCGKITGTATPDLDTIGVQVVYDFRYVRTHGIAKSSTGAPWLIEISSDRGILAMPLPGFANNEVSAKSKISVVTEIKSLFGFVPSGATFPSGSALTAAIADGSVLQLKTAADMASVYAKSPLKDSVGWTFNTAGTEAHNVVFYTSGTYRGYTGYKASHYRIDFTIGATVEDREPGEPIATASADVVLVEDKYRLGQSQFWASGARASGYQPLATIPLPNWGGGGLEDEYPAKWPVFACFVDDTLEVIYEESQLVPWTGNNYPGQYQACFSCTSPRYPAPTVLMSNSDSTTTAPGVRWDVDGSPLGYTVGTDATEALTLQTGFTPDGSRDSYVIVKKRGARTSAVSSLWGTISGSGAGLADKSFPVALDPWVNTSIEPSFSRHIVLGDGRVLSVDFGERVTTETTPASQANPYSSPSLGGTSTTVSPTDPIPDTMGRNTAGFTSYIVRYSVMGSNRPAIYSDGTDWSGRSSDPLRCFQFRYSGIGFDGVAQPITGFEQFSFVGYT